MHNFKVGDIVKKVSGVRAGYVGRIEEIRDDYISGVITERVILDGEHIIPGMSFGDMMIYFELDKVTIFNNKLDKIIND